jgi:TP901 family phage tail tape measure protein
MADAPFVFSYEFQPSAQAQSKLQAQAEAMQRNLKNLNLPLGRISSDISLFNRSMDAANQRVIAFGASLAVLGTTAKIFKDVVQSTIAVEKALTDINSVFQLGSRDMDKFAKDLFNVARNTSQSFATASEAAKEFSRQGLSAQETLKRTRDALILTRLAGLETTEAVETLTAAVNGFQKNALTTTQILNKLAIVDQSFAVSSKDLAQGLARAGAAAADAGVDFDELVGLITAAQQTTARGGAIIGNALKSIFTRIERKDTIDAMEALGVAVRDTEGYVLPAMRLLENFAQTYDKLGVSARKQAAELVGGVYQINQLKALLGDLAKAQNSVTNQAAGFSSRATDEALRRNEALNKSFSALAEQVIATNQQIFSNIGNVGFSGAAKGLLGYGLTNPITAALQDASGQAETAGGKFAESFIKGFGAAIIYGLGPLLVTALGRVATRTLSTVGADFAQLAIPTARSPVRVPRAAEGYIPAMNAERAAIAAGIGGAPVGSRAVYLPTFNRGSGQSGIVANTSEWVVPHMAGGSAIFNQDMIRKHGLPRGAVPVAAQGYVPNAASSYFSRHSLIPPPPAGPPPFTFPTLDATLVARLYNSGTVAPGPTTFGSGDLRYGSAGLGLSVNRHDLDILNDLFRNLSATASKVQAAKFSSQIVDAVGSLDKLSRSKVLEKMDRAYTQALYRSEDTTRAASALIANSTLSGRIPLRFGADAANQSVFGINGRGADAFQANLALSGFGSAIQNGPFRNQYIDPMFDRVMGRRARQEAFNENAIYGFNPQLKAQVLNQISARNDWFTSSTERQRGIGFDRAIGRVSSGIEITPAQQKLVQEVFMEKGRELASKVFAPGASQQAVRAFVRQYADTQIEKLNEAGNAALVTRAQQAAANRPVPFWSGLKNLSPGQANALGLTAAFALPAAGSLIPQGRGGTLGGIAGGAASSLLTGAGFGASTGLAFGGGVGALAGGIIGGVGGGIFGAIKKLEISFEELAGNFERVNAKLRSEAEAATTAIRLYGELREMVADKAAPAEIKAKERQIDEQISLVGNDDVRKLLRNNINDPDVLKKSNAILSGVAGKNQKQQSALGSLKGAFETSSTFGLFGYGDGAEGRLADGLTGTVAGMSDKEFAQYQALARSNPLGAMKLILKASGSSDKEIDDVLNTRIRDEIYARSAAGPLIGGSPSPTATMELIQNAQLRATGVRMKRGVTPGNRADKIREELVSRQSLQGLISASELNTNAGILRSGGNQQIAQTAQDIQLSRELPDLVRLSLQGQFGRTNIQDRFAGEREGALGASRTGLLKILDKSGVNSRATIEAVRGVGSLDQLVGLQGARLDPNGKLALPTGVSGEFDAALREYIANLRKLNQSEAESLRTNDTTNKLQKERMAFLETQKGAEEEYTDTLIKATYNLNRAKSRNEGIDVLQQLATIQGTAAANLGVVNGTMTQSQADSLIFGNARAGSADLQRRQRLELISAARAGSRTVSGSDIEGATFGEAKFAGQNGDFKGSFIGGFRSPFDRMKRDFQDLSDLGRRLGTTLSDSLGNAFGDFATGAKSAKDAFRDFTISVLNDASRAFASQAVQGILGSVFGFGGPFGAKGSAAGGPIGMARGGTVPAMLMGGEYYIGPKAAKRIGYDVLHKLNGYAEGGMVRGGSGVKDDVPANLPRGSFIVRKSAVQKLGPDYLSALTEGRVQHRFFGGLLLGALLGGGLGYVTGGKKGAIAGALIGGIGGGLAQNYSQTGSLFHSSSGSGATLTIGGGDLGAPAISGAGVTQGAAAAVAPINNASKIGLYLAAAGLLGGAAALARPNTDKFVPMNAAQISANRLALESAQASAFGQRPAPYPILQVGPQGSTYIPGYTDTLPTRHWAEGGVVDTSMPVGSSNSGGSSNVHVKIEINNNGGITSSASADGGGLSPDFAQKLQKQVRGMVQDEIVNQSRSGGFFAQQSRFIQR